MENQLVQLVKESGLEQSKAQVLLTNFQNYFEIAAEWDAKVNSLVVTDVSQVAEMRMAGEARKFLKSKRIDVENTRKQLKEQSLREGQTIDSIARVLKNLIEPIEEKAEQIEKFKEIQEEKALQERLSDRIEKLIPFNVAIDSSYLKLMPEDQFSAYLTGLKVEAERKAEEARKAEEERIALEKAEAEERERIRKENERLKKEAEEREKQIAAERAKAEQERKSIEEKARKEREAAEAKLKAEQEAAKIAAEKAAAERAKLEAEIRAKKEAEEKAIREAEEKRKAEENSRIEAERKAKLTPDKDKICDLIIRIDSFQLPDVNDEKAKEIVLNVKSLLAKISSYASSKVNEL